MNWVYTLFQFIYCLHCCVIFGVHSKHFKNNNNYNNNNHKNNNNNNENFDNNFWDTNEANYESQGKSFKHRISEHDIWNNYQSYQPSIDETLAMARYEASTERPPYYLSYDSGIKTRFEAQEEELIHQNDFEQQKNEPGKKFNLD